MQHLFRRIIFLCFLTATISGIRAPAKDSGVQIGTAENVRITTLDEKTGERAVTVAFKEAAPVEGSMTTIDGNAVLAIRGVTIKSFSAGKQLLEISAPECRYDNAAKTASGARPINAVAELFTLSGEDWIWKNENSADTVRIAKNVRVTLKSNNSGQSPVTIVSDTLDAFIPKNTAGSGQTRFVFSGNVSARMDARMKDGSRNEVSLTSDTLIVRANAGAKNINPLAGGETQKAAGALHALESVSADGHAHIVSAGREMSGDTATFTQSDETFVVQGNTRVEDAKQRLTVTGDKLVHRLDSGKVEVSGNASPGGTARPVVLTAPSFTREKAPSLQAPDVLATVTGNKLSVEMTPTKNRVDFVGNARVRDGGFDLSAGKLFVETPHDNALFTPDVGRTASVDLIVAEQDVRTVYEGVVLKCERAEIHPKKNTIDLTGMPVAESLKSGAALAAYAVSINTKEHKIEARSDPTVDSSTRRRVIVTLPALKSAEEQRRENPGVAPIKTTVTSDTLVMFENEKTDTAEFNFKDNVFLHGAGIKGTCAQLDVYADTKKPTGRSKTKRAGDQSPDASQIRQITAIGFVNLETDKCKIRAGRADIYPHSVFTENSPRDDNGMDGREPQFITLQGDSSTPGVRPAITLFNSALPDAAGIPGGDNAASQKPSETTGAITIESNYQELFNGSERARFFLRDNVAITGTNLSGRCDTVEGETLRPLKKDQTASPEVTRIVGRGNVAFKIKDNLANGEKVEIVPGEKKIRLTGNPQIKTGDGITASPGGFIVYDWDTKNWRMEAETLSTANEPPVQIKRPTIRIPLRSGKKSRQ